MLLIYIYKYKKEGCENMYTVLHTGCMIVHIVAVYFISVAVHHHIVSYTIWHKSFILLVGLFVILHE